MRDVNSSNQKVTRLHPSAEDGESLPSSERVRKPSRTRLLNAQEEVQLASTLRDSTREMLSLALASTTAPEVVAGMLDHIRGNPSDVWLFVERQTGDEGVDTIDAAIERLTLWYEALLDATKQKSFSARARLARNAPLTSQAREQLERRASSGLTPNRRALFKAAQRRVRSARAMFVRHNQGLVIQCATRLKGFGVPLSDLVQEGNLGLLRAIEKFDPDLGYRFSTYAVWWVRQAVRRAVDCQGGMVRLPVHLQEARRRVRRAELYMHAGDSPPSEEAIAKAANLSEAKVRELRELTGSATSIDDCDPGDRPLSARLVDEAVPDALDEALRTERISLLQSTMSRLTPREQVMLQQRFGLDGLGERSLREVGLQFGVTRERARQILLKAFDKLRPDLPEPAR